MKIQPQALLRFTITAVIVIVALLLSHALWRHYLYAPWTRDGRVRAEVVRIAPDVSGLVTKVPVIDNQEVKKGDVLFEIDPERYHIALAQAEANLNAAKAAARAAGANIDAVLASAAARKAEDDMRQEQAQRLSILHGLNAPEFFDKSLFRHFIQTLLDQGVLRLAGIKRPDNGLSCSGAGKPKCPVSEINIGKQGYQASAES